MQGVFLQEFLRISNVHTILFIGLLVISFGVIYFMAKRGASFGNRVTFAMIIGALLGLGVQWMSGFSDNPAAISYVAEIDGWFGLFGNGFMALIQMLVIPLVTISIIHVIIDMKEDTKIGSVVRNTVIVTMSMVAISAVVGLTIGVVFGIGNVTGVVEGSSEIREVSSIVQTLANLIPSNPVGAMVNMNVIGLVIFSAFIGMGARRVNKTNPELSKSFYELTEFLHKLIVSVAMSVISLIPYAIVAMIARTIMLRGLSAIVEVGGFILAIYAGVIVMFLLQLVQLLVFGVNPIHYLKKSIHVMILAFTSRSSVGTLPVTIDVLSNELGVNRGTASFVASFGTTAGMQGCAGVFPAMLIVFVARTSGIPLDLPFLFMSIIVISLGSLGIAGIPGTSTMAASVSLSGVGLGAYFPMISSILAIDPIIDMARTLLNVTGAMVNSITVDRLVGTFDMAKYSAEKSTTTESTHSKI